MEPMSLCNEAASWGCELERPEESVNLLEVWPDSEDLVDDILSTVDSKVSEVLRDEGVVGQRDSGSVNLQVTSLVDKLSDGSE